MRDSPYPEWRTLAGFRHDASQVTTVFAAGRGHRLLHAPLDRRLSETRPTRRSCAEYGTNGISSCAGNPGPLVVEDPCDLAETMTYAGITVTRRQCGRVVDQL